MRIADKDSQDNSYGTKEQYRSLINGKAKIRGDYNPKRQVVRKAIFSGQHKGLGGQSIRVDVAKALGEIWAEGQSLPASFEPWLRDKIETGSDILPELAQCLTSGEQTSTAKIREFKQVSDQDLAILSDKEIKQKQAVINACKEAIAYHFEDCNGFERLRFQDGFYYQISRDNSSTKSVRQRQNANYNKRIFSYPITKHHYVPMPYIKGTGAIAYLQSKGLQHDDIRLDDERTDKVVYSVHDRCKISVRESNSKKFYDRIFKHIKPDHESLANELQLLGYTWLEDKKEDKADPPKYVSKIGEHQHLFVPTLTLKVIEIYLSAYKIDTADCGFKNDCPNGKFDVKIARQNSRTFWAKVFKQAVPYWLVEGELKAYTAISHGILAIAYTGATNLYRVTRDNDDNQNRQLKPDFKEMVLNTNCRGLIYDFDAKPTADLNVGNAIKTVAELLNRDCPNNNVLFVRCPGIAEKHFAPYFKKTGKHFKQGFDDYLKGYDSYDDKIAAINALDGENTTSIIYNFEHDKTKLRAKVTAYQKAKKKPQRTKQLISFRHTLTRVNGSQPVKIVAVQTDRIGTNNQVKAVMRMPGVKILKTPTGTGKSYLGQQIAKDWAIKGEKANIICPQNSIADDWVKDLQTISNHDGLPIATTKNDARDRYKDQNIDPRLMMDNSNILALCLPKLPEYAQNRKHLVIEEISEIISQLDPNNNCALFKDSQHRQTVEDKLIELITYSIQQGGDIIINDADITQLDIDWLQQRIGNKTPIIAVINEVSKQVYPVTMFDNEQVIIDTLTEKLLAGEKVYLSSFEQAFVEASSLIFASANIESLQQLITDLDKKETDLVTQINSTDDKRQRQLLGAEKDRTHKKIEGCYLRIKAIKNHLKATYLKEICSQQSTAQLKQEALLNLGSMISDIDNQLADIKAQIKGQSAEDKEILKIKAKTLKRIRTRYNDAIKTINKHFDENPESTIEGLPIDVLYSFIEGINQSDYEIWEQKNADKNCPKKIIKRIDSTTTDKDNPNYDPFAKLFLEGTNQQRRELLQSHKVDCLICSPSLSTSFSIEVNYFDCVFGIYNDTFGASKARQSLNRVRDNVPRYVFIRDNYNIDLWDNSNFYPKALHDRKCTGQLLQGEYESKIIQLTGELEAIEKSRLGVANQYYLEQIRRIQSEQTELTYSARKAVNNIDKACANARLLEIFEGAGCEIAYNTYTWLEVKELKGYDSSHKPIAQITRSDISEIKEVRLRECFGQDIDKLKVGRNEYATTEQIIEQIRNKDFKSYRDRQILNKYRLLTEYPGIVLGDDIAYVCSHSSNYEKKAVMHYIWENSDQRLEKDIALKQSIAKLEKAKHPTLFSIVPAQIDLLRQTGIDTNINELMAKGVFTLSDDIVLAIAGKIISDKNRFNNLFRLNLHPDSKFIPEKYLIKVLGKILPAHLRIIDTDKKSKKVRTQKVETEDGVQVFDDNELYPESKYRIINTLLQSSTGKTWEKLLNHKSIEVRTGAVYKSLAFDNFMATMPAKFEGIKSIALPTENNPSPAIDSFLESIPEDEIQDEFISFDCTDSKPIPPIPETNTANTAPKAKKPVVQIRTEFESVNGEVIPIYVYQQGNKIYKSSF